MIHPNCCRFRLASLNSLSKRETTELRGEHSQTLPSEFTQNPVETATSFAGTETLQPICDISVPLNSGGEPSENPDSQDPDLGPKRTMFFRIGKNKSNSRLHDIAKVVRKRVSRESEASKGSSKKSSKPSLKEEELARRKELRRALHRRLEEELLRDSEDGYDSDAVPIIDFAGTLGGNDDSTRSDEDQIRHVAARFKASSPLSARGSQRPSYLPGQAWQSDMDMGVSHHISYAQPLPNLHASRSADFTGSVLQYRAPGPSRRRSTQNITIRKPSSVHPNKSASEAINDNPARFIAQEKIVAMALDGLNGDCKVRAQYKSDDPQIFASYSLNGVQKPQEATLAKINVSESSESPPCSSSHTPAFLNLDAKSSSIFSSEKTDTGRHMSGLGLTLLQVPVAQSHAQRVASSNYSTCVDSFESSRRSSLIKIQSLSDRLANLKSSPTSDHILGGSSACASLEAEGLHFRHSNNRTSDAGALKPCDIPLSRATEKCKADFSHEDLIFRKNRHCCRKKEFSSESQNINVQGFKHADENNHYTPCRLHGYGHDLVGSADVDVSFVRDRALRDHAGNDSPVPQTMPVSNEALTTRKSLDSRTQESAKRKVRPGLQRGVEFNSSESLQEHLQPNKGSDSNLPITVDTYLPGDKAVLINTGTTAAPSWCRYPSYNRVERSFSPAGTADNVVSRDFAIEFRGFGITDEQKETKSSRKKKSRSLTFGRSIMSTLSQIYSIDLRRQHKGHRSSISVGGKLEYPELEILPQLSPTLRPLDVVEQQDIITSGPRAMHPITSEQSIVRTSYPFEESINAARSWSKLYEDCVHRPVDGEERRTGGKPPRILLRSSAGSDSARIHSNDGELSPHSSGDMRSSTSDFHRSLLDQEAKEKERALQAVGNAWGKSRALP